jgi:hypothetical protein
MQAQYFRSLADVSLLALRWAMQVSIHARSAAVSFAAKAVLDKLTALRTPSAAILVMGCPGQARA